jgi:hypothetical protein
MTCQILVGVLFAIHVLMQIISTKIIAKYSIVVMKSLNLTEASPALVLSKQSSTRLTGHRARVREGGRWVTERQRMRHHRWARVGHISSLCVLRALRSEWCVWDVAGRERGEQGDNHFFRQPSRADGRKINERNVSSIDFSKT